MDDLTGIKILGYAICGYNASPDFHGHCTCDDGFTEHINGEYCVTCDTISGVGATHDGANCECHTYAKVDSAGVCQCLGNYTETTGNTCFPCEDLSDVAKEPGECTCID